MIYNDMPLIIPVLATGYLLTVYLLLVLAQRTTKELHSRVLSGSKALQEQKAALVSKVVSKVPEASSVR